MIALADGARWIWHLVNELVPHALQILAFSHAKHYLWEAGKILYGEGSALVAPRIKERETLLLGDKGEQVIAHLQHFLDLRPALAPILHYFQHNAARMRYATDRQRGYLIGSGAIESAGKPMTAARIKGPGMRWNVQDLNALLALRCVFLAHSGRRIGLSVPDSPPDCQELICTLTSDFISRPSLVASEMKHCVRKYSPHSMFSHVVARQHGPRPD